MLREWEFRFCRTRRMQSAGLSEVGGLIPATSLSMASAGRPLRGALQHAGEQGAFFQSVKRAARRAIVPVEKRRSLAGKHPEGVCSARERGKQQPCGGKAPAGKHPACLVLRAGHEIRQLNETEAGTRFLKSFQRAFKTGVRRVRQLRVFLEKKSHELGLFPLESLDTPACRSSMAWGENEQQTSDDAWNWVAWQLYGGILLFNNWGVNKEYTFYME